MDLSVSILDKKIRDAGIPIDGVAKEIGGYRVDFRPAATQQQRDQAAVIVAAFNPSEATAKEAEINAAPGIAQSYFATSPAAVAFVRLTPQEQASQIDAMTLAQLKTVVKFLAVATSVLIKRGFL